MRSIGLLVFVLSTQTAVITPAQGAGRPDPCKNYVCQNGGSCTYPADAPYCECLTNYTGLYCENDMRIHDPCRDVVCQNGGSCTFPADAPYCECLSNYTGLYCENDMSTGNVCKSYTCINGGRCISPSGNPVCQCQNGFSGDNCEVKVKDGVCVSSSGNSEVGLCAITCNNDYECQGKQKCCSTVCGGRTCSSDLSENPCDRYCLYGGFCTDTDVCDCPNGFSGDRCEVTPHPGECPQVEPHSMGVCGGTMCTIDDNCASVEKCCPSACGGKLCTKDILPSDPCSNFPCYNEGRCSSDGGVPVCECPYPYGGTKCLDKIKTRSCPSPDEEPPYTCGNFTCTYDSDCSWDQKCCSICGNTCTDPVPEKCGNIECSSDQICRDKIKPCPPGLFCTQALDPTCVPVECANCEYSEDCAKTSTGYKCFPYSQKDLCGGCENGTVCIETENACSVTKPCQKFQCVKNNECGGCPDGKVCINTGIVCIKAPCPTYKCVENNECGGCNDGQVCLDTGLRCFKAPCPTYKCVENNECGGCNDGQVCINTGIECITDPCPTTQCVEDNECGGCPDGQVCKDVGAICKKAPCSNFQCTLENEPQCPLRCSENYKCQLQKYECTRNIRYPCLPSLRPTCVPTKPELGKCPKVSKRGLSKSVLCLFERIFVKCKDEDDCKRANERCCPSACGNKVCKAVNRRTG